MDALPDNPPGAATPGSAFARLRRLNSLGFWTVALPTLLAAYYYGLAASDIFVSESRLVLRSTQQPAVAGLGNFLQGIGVTRDQGDAHSVRDFILSRDALTKLNEEFRLDRSFGNEKIDVVKRFAGLDWWNHTFEGLHRYYVDQVVTVEVDTASAIVTLVVKAFSADQAQQINERLVEMSEDLINKLNQRSRQDMIRFALADVDIAEKKAEAAALAMAKYRSTRGVFDPEKQSPLNLARIGKLEEQLIANETQLAQIRAVAPGNPQIQSLEKQSESLQQAIDAETARLTGGGRSLSGQAVEYQRLAFEQAFAAKQLEAAQASLESARAEARRKQVYVERLVQPGKPDIAVQPRRLRGVMATLISGVVIWGILSILIAGVREHSD